MSTLPCADGAGSINNPDNEIPVTPPYLPTTPCVGQWEISGADDTCARNEGNLQESYAAENLNINGAPLNIFKLLGVHEQGDGSILSKGTIFGANAEPGYPISNINNGGAWHSSLVGSSVTGNAFIGVDFGFLNQQQYAPVKPNLQYVGAVAIKQGNTAFNFAKQARVDITDGKTQVGVVSYSGNGNGVLTNIVAGPALQAATIVLTAMSATDFMVVVRPVIGLTKTFTMNVNNPFESMFVSFQINASSVPFNAGDTFSFTIDYEWKRVGVFNLKQSQDPITMNLMTPLLVKAVRVVPTMFTGTTNWEVIELDVFDSPPTNINNVQDLFFQENRDRDYAKKPLFIKAQYTINDSVTDLSKFGLNILDQYNFTVSFATMVNLLGRPVVTGDVIEVIPEMQYDHNLKPVKKFLEVTDTGWASSGFTSGWKPTLYRFAAQQLLASQETRDIFGTLDTQKYLTADSILSDGLFGNQLDVSGLTSMEELNKEADKKVPERGSDDGVSIAGVPNPIPAAPVNAKGQPEIIEIVNSPNIYIEDGLPKDGSAYQEGYALPDVVSAVDGSYFRLYYPDETKIAPRLYRFSAVKGRWLFLEQDRRTDYTSTKPSIGKILNSATRQGLSKK